MKNSYLAICYVCNENCLFCPCSKNEKLNKMITSLECLKKTVDEMEVQNITDITISGGEPTLHPNFIELIKYIQEKNINITILTNSEKFSNETFLKTFLKNIDYKKIKVITTLHSSEESEHEQANQTPGSFRRTIEGLKILSNNGVRVIIKHCITKSNYMDLKKFYIFCDDLFNEDVEVQLCSIDYCGIPEEKLEVEMLSFVDLKPFLEQTFDTHLERKSKGSKRRLACINMPLCSCDVYYWEYLPTRRRKMYDTYKDPHREQILNINDNVGICEPICNECKVASICNGTYYTAFNLFGRKIIKPYT